MLLRLTLRMTHSRPRLHHRSLLVKFRFTARAIHVIIARYNNAVVVCPSVRPSICRIEPGRQTVSVHFESKNRFWL